MKMRANILLWSFAAMAIVVVVLSTQNSSDDDVDIALKLPGDSPDLFLTEMDLTRINSLGEATIYAKADTLSVYNELGESRLTNPNVVLNNNGQATWRVTSESATLFDDDTITFLDNVLATQLDSHPAMMVSSEKINVIHNGSSINTDLPVTITKGIQVVNAVGMVGDLNTAEPQLELLSDVRFQYDPS